MNQNAKIAIGIERLSTMFRAILWEDVKHHALSPLQAQILLFITLHGAALNSVSHLAKEFAVTKATISDAVRVLLEKKLLEKQSGDDGRAYSLILTENGKAYTKKLSTPADFMDTVLIDASPEEIEKIWEGLLLLLNHMQKSGIIPLRMCFSCQYYGRSDVAKAPHYCKLLQKNHTLMDIRLDCEEHINCNLAAATFLQ